MTPEELAKALSASVVGQLPADFDEDARLVLNAWVEKTSARIVSETAAIPKDDVRVQSASLYFKRKWDRALKVVKLLEAEGLSGRISLLEGLLDLL